MELEVTQAFPTPIGRLQVPDAEAMNEALQAIILAEEAKCASIGRSNIGGWHSRPDFLVRSEPAVAALTGWITWAVSRMVKATAGFGQSDESLSLSGWSGDLPQPRCISRAPLPSGKAPGLACTTWKAAPPVRHARSVGSWSSSTRASAHSL